MDQEQERQQPQPEQEFHLAGGPMALPASSLMNAEGAPAESDSPIGRVLQGRYKIAGVLGRGGFGSVYRVTDLRLPGKFWALKELHFRDNSQLEEAKRSFEREARLLSTLIHRSLPVIVDYFSEGNSTYLLMEEIDGCTLAQLVEEKGPPSEVQALRWALEIAQVLEYLHNQNPPVIFRDLKPENVMVAQDGHIKLIDFGLARFFDPNKTRDTTAVGSIGYAPPEVWEDSTQTDARSDIYSFGATLYFVLTGRPPSPVYGRHQIAPYRSDLNPDFVNLVQRCMQVKPEDRYQNMGQIIRELISILSKVAADDPLLKDELRAESFSRVASQSLKKPSHILVASASVAPRSEGVNNLPISQLKVPHTPKMASWLLLLCLFFFGLGAWGGYQDVLRQYTETWEFETPYELVNPDKEEARNYIREQNWPKAMQSLSQAVTLHPSDAEAHIMRENVSVHLSGKPYFRLPALMSMTGMFAPEAYRLLYGVAMAQLEFNRQGGDDQGRLVVIDIFDEQSSMETVTRLATAIIKDPDYLGMVGPFSSQFALSIAPLFNAAQFPIITPVVSAPGIWEQGRFIFTASDTNYARCKVIANYLRDRGCQRALVMVDQDSILSSNVADYFKDSFQEMGGEIVATPTFVNVNFNQAFQDIENLKPDCIFFSDHRGTPLALFAKELRERGITVPLASQVAPFTKDLLAVGGPAVEGIILAGYFHSESEDPLSQDYSKRFRELFGGISPSHLDASAYDATKILLSAYKAGVHTREGMQAYLASIGADPQMAGARPSWHGATGKFSLSRMLDIRDVYLIRIERGRYHLVKVFPGGVSPSTGPLQKDLT